MSVVRVHIATAGATGGGGVSAVCVSTANAAGSNRSTTTANIDTLRFNFPIGISFIVSLQAICSKGLPVGQERRV